MIRRAMTEPPPPTPKDPRPLLRSQDILAGAREVRILHGEDVYRLRLTSTDKLILTK